MKLDTMTTGKVPRRQGWLWPALCLLCAFSVAGCHWDMWDGARLKPLEASAFFEDGQSSRTIVAGTVSYMSPLLDEHFATGRVNGELVDRLPSQIALTRGLLDRGRNRFAVFCYPCHGARGEGNGMITLRGFPAPPSYHIDRLREAELGYFVDVMTNGFGRMFSYASRVPPKDRWAIAAYIRALQLSQSATPALLPADVLEKAQHPEPDATQAEHETQSEH